MLYDLEENIKVIVGRYKVPVRLGYKGERIYLHFKYNKSLIAEVKVMSGARYHGFDEVNPRKVWSIANDAHNHFNLAFLKGEDPFALYKYPLDETIKKILSTATRPLYSHQVEMIAHMLIKHYVIIACEQGTGKSLAALELCERAGLESHEVLYVGPVSGVHAVSREFIKWGTYLKPKMISYDKLGRGYSIDPVPKCVIFDESSRVKNPQAKRSIAALSLAEKVRDTYKGDGYVILMSGTPAPRVPVDWYHQCSIACPGYIREGNIHKFKQRLCVIENRESITGGIYPHVVTWLDDENKCASCGRFKADPVHDIITALSTGAKYHDFIPARNEVQYLYERMKGLVLVKFKKDCLDLPEKQYQIITVKPTVETIRMAQLIQKTSSRAIQALTLLRELSDGFQYREKEIGKKVCTLCKGKKEILAGAPLMIDDDSIDGSMSIKYEEEVNPTEKEMVSCPHCGGTGEETVYDRTVEEITTPKDGVLEDLLDDHEEVGRLIVWAGFTGSIDRICDICHRKGWSTLRVDGRGYTSHDVLGHTIADGTYLDCMDASNPNRKQLLIDYPKVCFVGHPKAGGMALTLTASPTELYYSNSFDGEARMQSEDRFHRIGMDTNRGATIIDIIHLPTDKLILDNLLKKKRLQSLTMGQLAEVMNHD